MVSAPAGSAVVVQLACPAAFTVAGDGQPAPCNTRPFSVKVTLPCKGTEIVPVDVTVAVNVTESLTLLGLATIDGFSELSTTTDVVAGATGTVVDPLPVP